MPIELPTEWCRVAEEILMTKSDIKVLEQKKEDKKAAKVAKEEADRALRVRVRKCRGLREMEK
jgi:hypothetical protein